MAAKNFDVEVEFIAGKQLLADVNNIGSEILEEKLYQLDVDFAAIHADEKKTRTNFHLPITLELSTTVFGSTTVRTATFDENTIAELEKVKPKPLDSDSLQNDIRYIDNILASFLGTLPEEPNWDGVRTNIHEARVWVYHILKKHFDIPTPEAMLPPETAESKPIEDSNTVRS